MLLGASKQDISSNARLLEYPFASPMVQVSNRDIFRAPGWEARDRPYIVPAKGLGVDPERAAISSKCRAKREVRDIAMCNRFTFFFTWTLDPSCIDRYSIEDIRKKVTNWLRNQSARKGFQYLCIVEKHKDGAIHFHGLCNLGKVKIERAINPHTGKRLVAEKGQPIYNMTDWTLGFSTCIPIDENYERTCNYLTKYFEKDFSKIFGKWYFASRNLRRRPDITLLSGMYYDDFVRDNADEPDFYDRSVFGDVRIAGIRLAEG